MKQFSFASDYPLKQHLATVAHKMQLSDANTPHLTSLLMLGKAGVSRVLEIVVAYHDNVPIGVLIVGMLPCSHVPQLQFFVQHEYRRKGVLAKMIKKWQSTIYKVACLCDDPVVEYIYNQHLGRRANMIKTSHEQCVFDELVTEDKKVK